MWLSRDKALHHSTDDGPDVSLWLVKPTWSRELGIWEEYTGAEAWNWRARHAALIFTDLPAAGTCREIAGLKIVEVGQGHAGKQCTECEGAGRVPLSCECGNTGLFPCPECKGTGQKQEVDDESR